MSSAETKSFNFVFIAKSIGAWIHYAVFAAVLPGLVLTLLTEASAEVQCATGWEATDGEEITGTLQNLSPGVKLSPGRKYYTERFFNNLHKGQKLTIEVRSSDFRPRVEVYRAAFGNEPMVAYRSGNPALIEFEVRDEGNYKVVVTTYAPGASGQYSWAHSVCEQEEKASSEIPKGKPCSQKWIEGKRNYRGPVDDFERPKYQGICSLGSCKMAGTDKLTGYTYKTGFWTFNTETQRVEIFEELYNPRLDTTFYCKDK